MRRGALAHAVLERTLALLRGAHRLRADRARAARRRARRAPATPRRACARGAEPARRRALLRGLEADLERYLRTEAECGAGYEPTRARVVVRRARTTPTGRSRSAATAASVTGRVDRVDVGPGGAAIVRDYKGRTVVGGVKWADELQLQVALYLLAVRELLGHEPVAGLYQPLAGRKLGARGLVRDDVPGSYTRTDVVDGDAFAARSRPRASSPRAPRPTCTPAGCAPCPERCSSRGCRYPGICRAGEPRAEPPA